MDAVRSSPAAATAPGNVFLSVGEARQSARMMHADIDLAIEELLRRWWRVPADISPQRFRRGARLLLSLQALAFGLLALLS